MHKIFSRRLFYGAECFVAWFLFFNIFKLPTYGFFFLVFRLTGSIFFRSLSDSFQSFFLSGIECKMTSFFGHKLSRKQLWVTWQRTISIQAVFYFSSYPIWLKQKKATQIRHLRYSLANRTVRQAIVRHSPSWSVCLSSNNKIKYQHISAATWMNNKKAFRWKIMKEKLLMNWIEWNTVRLRHVTFATTLNRQVFSPWRSDFLGLLISLEDIFENPILFFLSLKIYPRKFWFVKMSLNVKNTLW